MPARFPYADGRFEWDGVSFVLWMVQRALDRLAAMPAVDAQRTRQWIRDSGGAHLLEREIPRLEVSGLTDRIV